MIETITDLPVGIDGVRCQGKLTREDYDTAVVPLLDEALREHRKLRCLVEVDSIDGITPAAAFDDVTLGLRALGAFEGCAVLTDLAWIGELARFGAFLLPYPLRAFALDQRAEAIAWLAELPGSPRITHRMVAEASVVVVEAADPLRVQDVEALATVVDGWLADHPSLHGLVLHARALPGWENVGGLVKHLQFVLDHHLRIDKVALTVDGTLAAAAAAIAEHVVHAQVRRFGYDEQTPGGHPASGGHSDRGRLRSRCDLRLGPGHTSRRFNSTAAMATAAAT